MTANTPPASAKFCSECATPLNPNAKFCHNCAAPVEGSVPGAAAPGMWSALRWGVPALAVLALAAVIYARSGATVAAPDGASAMPLGAAGGAGGAKSMDIGSMSPEERADRLFNRVMRLWGEGKADSAAFFAPMAMGAIEALAPLDAHRRYDMGLVALVGGDVKKAAAEADTILARSPNHLLGYVLAARAAEASGSAPKAQQFREKLVAAEKAERAKALPEYTDHDADIKAAAGQARKPKA